VCVTGQQREMLDQVLEVFEVVPDNNLRVMRPGQGLAELAAQILTRMQEQIEATKLVLVFVHGDTTTVPATSIAAFDTGVPIGHLEAGLRTSNLRSPFPEEFNRQVISKISTWHFAPTELSRQNLVAEGV
jgi:UDP-N-acetylglucosamine 2-epimerase (non-hydrolysing)